jgi:anaerobic magnesium-protoporphyrin IX monomethyl ester cyclase
MGKIDVVLVGYENQENLGLRSITSYLISNNFTVFILPFQPGKESEILAIIKKLKPKIIGFSFIFQYTLTDFGKLIHYLRKHGIKCHFTAGGHFPSIEPLVTFEEIPELNSIVRFEGEETLYELLLNINNPEHWINIQGLAFKKGSKVIINTPRPLIDDLDKLPLIFRDNFRESSYGIKTAYMLASRGCLYNCSFCSIRNFYKSTKGALRRTRSARAVVDEMYNLFSEHNVRFFSFQDDDFANRSKNQKEWLFLFLKELKDKGLSNKIRWKISCRVDDLDPMTLEFMLENGLLAVYLGVESGSNLGLQTLNKGVTVDQNFYAINLLKKYNVAMSIGFMLFDPSSNIESIKQNIQFLRKIGEDGYFPINFCKMLPYAGTPIEKQLIKEGRIKGTRIQPDYDFLDPIVNWYYFIVNRIFTKRNFKSDGLVSLLQIIDFEYHLKDSFNLLDNSKDYKIEYKQIIRKANISAVNTLENLLDMIITKGVDYVLNDKKALLELIEKEWQDEITIELELLKLKNSYLYKSKDILC